MTKKPKKRWLAGLLALLALMLFAPTSSVFAAGVLTFEDPLNLFSTADRATLTAQVKSLPFDVYIVTSNQYSNKTSFKSYVVGKTGATKTLTIGISNRTDATTPLRTVLVDPGSAMGITATESANIEEAAAVVLRANSGQWTAAVTAALNTAKNASSMSTGAGSMVGFVIFGGIILVIVFLVIAARRRMGPRPAQPVYAQPQQQYPQPQYPQQQYPQQPGYGPGYYPPQQQQDRGGGIGDALLGGVIGYEIGRMLGGGNQGGGSFDELFSQCK
ncbi:hypothetical protein [Candidatus Chlorohelix sp.]|uniref:hypothetical protein n=1 Tax=Candidatus Chlorohelix sp. TaxID=3139201 RepID=UPI00306015E1